MLYYQGHPGPHQWLEHYLQVHPFSERDAVHHMPPCIYDVVGFPLAFIGLYLRHIQCILPILCILRDLSDWSVRWVRILQVIFYYIESVHRTSWARWKGNLALQSAETLHAHWYMDSGIIPLFLHCPMFPGTFHIIPAISINCHRGPVGAGNNLPFANLNSLHFWYFDHHRWPRYSPPWNW